MKTRRLSRPLAHLCHLCRAEITRETGWATTPQGHRVCLDHLAELRALPLGHWGVTMPARALLYQLTDLYTMAPRPQPTQLPIPDRATPGVAR